MNHVPAEVAKNIRNVAVSRTKDFKIPGILVNAVASGMRYKNRLDLALIFAEEREGVSAAGVFTKNLFSAAPVILSKRHLAENSSTIKAILINAGIANACTGSEGLRRAEQSVEIVAKALGIKKESVLIASTGVIGPQINVDVIASSMDGLVSGLAPNKWHLLAEAIMTTDTVPKLSSVKFDINGEEILIGGTAKGSGMIAPDMATMLGFVCTNISIEAPIMQKALKEAVSKTFNAISVDGDTSTNDTVFLLSSGRSRTSIGDLKQEEYSIFYCYLESVLMDLAHQIVMDGEGATKFIEILVTGAPSEEDAKRIAKTVAESPLVKTAFYGEDANWGRVIAAVGRSGVLLDPSKVSLYFNDLCVFEKGMPVGTEEVEAEASRIFKDKKIFVRIDLAMGNRSFRFWTCDFSHDYVTINAKYRT